MGVRSDNFSKLIAMIVVEDKSGVVSFLRSQGINASESASNSAIIQAIGRGMQSDKFIDAFSQSLTTGKLYYYLHGDKLGDWRDLKSVYQSDHYLNFNLVNESMK